MVRPSGEQYAAYRDQVTEWTCPEPRPGSLDCPPPLFELAPSLIELWRTGWRGRPLGMTASVLRMTEGVLGTTSPYTPVIPREPQRQRDLGRWSPTRDRDRDPSTALGMTTERVPLSGFLPSDTTGRYALSHAEKRSKWTPGS
jgi:hypothetical protein